VRILVAIHDLPAWSIPPAEVARIARALPDDEVIDARAQDERLREIRGADVLFSTRVSAPELAAAARLTWIHTAAVGVTPLLQPELIEGDIVVTNSRGVHSEAIAEHAIALALAIRRSLHTAVRRQVALDWAQIEIAEQRVATLSHSHLLVIGLGTIGARVSALGAGLGMRVTGIRRRLDLPIPPGVGQVVPLSKLAEALGEADVIVLALPCTPNTCALIAEAEFAAMKRSAILVNVARGGLVDERALVRALDTRRIAGAGLDAFDQEPLPAEHPLWRLPNVLISPHTAAFTGDYWAPVVDLFLDNAVRFKAGAPLTNVVDKQAGY